MQYNGKHIKKYTSNVGQIYTLQNDFLKNGTKNILSFL